MSWRVDGVIYHDYFQYQQALLARAGRESAAAAARARAEAARLQERLRNAEQEAQRAQQSEAVQRRLNEQVRLDVARLAELQTSLRRTQEETAARAAAELSEVRKGLRLTQQEIQKVEQAQAEHAKNVAAQFEVARSELQRAQAEAEARRAAMEARLTQHINAVDAKVEADRKKAEARAQNERERAAASIAWAEARLTELESRLPALALEDDAIEARAQLTQARAVLHEGHVTQAHTLADGAVGAARALHKKAARRSSELEAKQAFYGDRLRALREDASREDIKRCFPGEVATAVPILDRLIEEISRGYKSHAALPVESQRHESAIERLEHDVGRIVVEAPGIHEAALARVKLAQEVEQDVLEIFGPGAKIERRLLRAGDPKSPLSIHFRYGASRPSVDIHVTLDGRVTLDSYGHESNTQCSVSAKALVKRLERNHGIYQTVIDSENRAHALPRTQVAQGWEGVAASLEQLGRKL